MNLLALRCGARFPLLAKGTVDFTANAGAVPTPGNKFPG